MQKRTRLGMRRPIAFSYRLLFERDRSSELYRPRIRRIIALSKPRSATVVAIR
jgi:hypothetical protein